jgi:PKD repeat protein
MTNLSEFDEIGIKPNNAQNADKIAEQKIDNSNAKTETPKNEPDFLQNITHSTNNNSQNSDQITQNSNTKPNPAKPINSKKVAIGCTFFFFLLFAILIIAMIFGLRAGEDLINSFGLSPVSFKNWTIGMVNTLFGLLALVSTISIIYNLGQRILAPKENFAEKKSLNKKITISGIFFVVILSLWFFVYSYIARFEMKPPELPIEILTKPEYTFELTSPLQVEFSAERITNKFKNNYDIVSYEWDKDSDGKIDDTGEKVSLYFPNGGRQNGVYNVKLLVRLQPKGGGEIEAKEYQKTISISKQNLYGEIEVDRESGEIPLTVKFNADNIADPDKSQIINYSWDLNGDEQADRDGEIYRKTEWTFDTIGEHTVTLTVTSEDFEEDGNHEQKIFTKTIIVHRPTGSDNADVWIEASPKKGFAPLTVDLLAKKRTNVGGEKSPRIEMYKWIIGDGLEILRGQRNRFTFEKPGIYPVELKITFSNGEIKQEMIEIIVGDESISPQAFIRTEPEMDRSFKAVIGPAPLRIKFDASESKDPDNNIVKYDWDFDGDGLWDSEGSMIEHEFRDTGKYETTLRVIDADNNESRAKINVIAGDELAVINFGASKLSGAAPLTINFDASGSRLPNEKKIISYEWDFAPHINSSDKQTFIYERAQTSHVFQSVGEHFIRLTLHADDGSKYFKNLKIIATYPVLNAEFSASRLSGNAPLSISFDADNSTGNIMRYEWIFNDGTTSNKKNPMHIFEHAGTYDVILKTYDNLGNVAQAVKTIVVK